jgi:hypothetical protein
MTPPLGGIIRSRVGEEREMSATNTIEIGSDLWNARVYAGLSVASELAAGLDSSKHESVPLLSVWKIYRRLGRLNQDLEEILKGYDRTNPFPQVIPGERNRLGRDILLKLHADCNNLPLPPDGALLHRLIVKRMNELQMKSERILDVADWLDVMSTPEETNAKFAVALADLAKGDVIPWAAVQ